MWINFTADATTSQPSILIPSAQGYYEPTVIPAGKVTVACTATGKSYTSKEA